MQLSNTLPFLAPAATSLLGPAQTTVDAAGRNVICFQVDQSTVFVPTTVFVTVSSAVPPPPALIASPPSLPDSPIPTDAPSDPPSLTQLTLTKTLDETVVVSPQYTPVPVDKKIYVIEYPKWGNMTNSTAPTNSTAGHNATLAHPPAVNVSDASLNKTQQARRNVVYFNNWSAYQQVPTDKVTHLVYAFADISPTGAVIASDSTGAAGRLRSLKQQQQHPHLKTLLSIGGSSSSRNFPSIAATEATRRTFARSAVRLVEDWGMDGIDIDWEYPQDEADAANFVQLLNDTRAALDSRRRSGGSYQLTVAAPAGAQHYKTLHLKQMDAFVDAWHLMAYDYAGPWDATTGHQANLRSDKTPATKAATDTAVRDYIAAGVPAAKIGLGMPLYGRSFANTDGLGRPFSDAGSPSGVYAYKDLPRHGAKVATDSEIGAAWSYDPVARELVSFDTPETARVKARYVLEKELGGMAFWEASGDKSGAESLIRTAADALGL